MYRLVGMVGAGLVVLVVAVAGAAGVGLLSLLTSGAVTPSASATAAIPAGMLTLYEQAATTCPGLPWTVLAAIGTVESSNGTSDRPGVHSGANFAGAEGPMQFEPATFAEYDRPVPPGGAVPPSPYDPTDAVFSAARLLCAHGAAGGADLSAAVFAFNHDTGYVTDVVDLAQSYGPQSYGPQSDGPNRNGPQSDGPQSDGPQSDGPQSDGPQSDTQSTAATGAAAVDWARAQVGTPYVWGGETPGVGFDCSGLVQAAYEAAGVSLPRVAQDQYDAGPDLPAGAALEPGDLVFFGGGPTDVSHVGIYVGTQGGQAVMVDAPHTGADVRVEPFPTVVGASFGGGEVYVGATRPSR